MFILKEVVEKIVLQQCDSLRCDICKIDLLKNKKEKDEASAALLTFIRTTAKDMRLNGVIDADDVHERESCEFCEKCYKKIIEFIKSLGAKVPSSFFADTPDFSEDEDSKT